MGRLLKAEEYKKEFWGKTKKEKALNHALEIRKFEIELYWKRATYFWTFIAASLAAYGLVQASGDILSPKKEQLSVLLGVLGFVFSFAWQTVNLASKYWQENWENHVALLEDDVIGPLFKSVSMGLTRKDDKGGRVRRFLTSPRNYSVSKINQLVSLFVVIVWVLLIGQAAHVFDAIEGAQHPHLWDPFSTFVVVFGAGACCAIWIWGRSSPHDHDVAVARYETIIKDKIPPKDRKRLNRR